MEALIVGAGGSGALHALALRAAGVRIAAVYDPNPERAHAVADACGAIAFSSWTNALAHDAQIAAVCSPPHVHVEQAEALATSRRGRTVFVEKPVATTRADLDRLRKISSCVPILQWRAGRALRALRRAVMHGELGDAPVASCDLDWSRDAEYFRSRRDWGCGALLSIGVHAIDAMAWALGREIEPANLIESAAGITTNLRAADAGVVGETSAVAIFRLTRGAMASLRISLDGGGDTTTITVCGAGKTAHLTGGEADPTAGALRWSARSARDRERVEALERDTPGALGSPLLVPYIARAVSAIRDGETPGQSQRLLSIADVASAHAAAMSIA